MSFATTNEAFVRLKSDLGVPNLHPLAMAPDGVSTGWLALDRFLIWRGLPKGSVSLFCREAGGATTLFTQAAGLVTRQKRWVAWINDAESNLVPWHLRTKQVDLSRLLWISSPKNLKQTLWTLQEILSLELFDLIGCDLGNEDLAPHQVLKLKRLALRYQTSLVLMSRSHAVRAGPFYALILRFHKQNVRIVRALHRPTPYTLERRELYADTLPQLTTGRRRALRS